MYITIAIYRQASMNIRSNTTKLKLLDSLLQEREDPEQLLLRGYSAVSDKLKVKAFGFSSEREVLLLATMGDDHDPGGGISNESSIAVNVSALPATSAWAGGRNSPSVSNVRLRSFEEIIQDATNNRNILEIRLQKNLCDSDPTVKPPNLTYDQLGEFLFDHLKINSEDCLRFNFSTPRYDTREVMLKPGVDLTPYIKVIQDFYGHTVTTKRQSSSIVRVSFRNVPLNVPDEEIIHLCNFFGKPIDNRIEYEKISGSKLSGSGATRYVDMEFTPGKRFMNYYWMEGPLPGDQGCRITVLHLDQERQCSHCLCTSSEGCRGQGQGKVCKELGTKMTRMSDYMNDIKNKTGYESLKSQFMKKFPALGTRPENSSSVYIGNEPEGTDEEQPKENEIDCLKRKVVTMEKEVEENRKNLEQRLHQAKRNGDLAKNKITTATECLDMFLVDNLKQKDFDEFDQSFKFLVTQYSSLLFTPECYTVNPDSCEVTISENLFSDIVTANPEISDKVCSFKKHLKEKLSLDFSVRRERRLSTGSFRSRLPSMSTKRGSDESKGNSAKISRPLHSTS